MAKHTTQGKNKTLVFSFDGTGNEPVDAGAFENDESISNVMKLNVLMGGGFKDDKSETTTRTGRPQRTYYYNGIGTREDGFSIPLLGSLISWSQKAINTILAPSFGDAGRILREAKKDFNESGYRKGDTLVVFGFSRGAALARKFAGMILRDHEECEVSFLGVFDTVAAMNGIHRQSEHISSDVCFENGTLDTRIKRAVHIVSLDENRVSFSPTLINKDDKNPKRILEIWFPGVHSDIGGGYWFDGLSDGALQFMINECEAALGDTVSIERGDNNKAISKLLEAQGKELSMLTVDDIAINPIVHGVQHTHTGLLAKIGNLDPRVVCVNFEDQPTKDLPLLHESVKDRFENVANYRPPALRGLTFKVRGRNKKTSGPICGVSGLRKATLPS